MDIQELIIGLIILIAYAIGVFVGRRFSGKSFKNSPISGTGSKQ